jgi:hypothetical protein
LSGHVSQIDLLMEGLLMHWILEEEKPVA